MTDQLFPDPLTPADCNLRGFPWMALDTVRLLDSDLFLLASGDEFKAALALWCKSWSQVPAASLPSDERLLAGLSGAKNWKKVRDVAMRGWVLCSDGRYYHPVVAEKALEALPAMKHHAEQKQASKERKQRERDDRKKLFDLLRSKGVVTDFNATTSKLRELAAPFLQQHPPDVTTTVTRDSHDRVTANTREERTGHDRTGPLSNSSVPIGTGGDAPPAGKGASTTKRERTPEEEEKSRLWAAMKTTLVDQHSCRDLKAAGEVMGKLAQKYGNDVFLEAARQADANKPGDLLTYFVALCETAAGKRQQLGRVGPISDAQRQAANDESTAEALRKIGGGPQGDIVDV